MAQIKHKDSGEILFELKDKEMIDAVSDAVKSRVDLVGAYLVGVNLSKTDLRGAYLLGASLRKAFLRDVNFSKAFLRGANFEGADLEGVNFEDANLEGVNFERASLKGAKLIRAELKNVNFRDAELDRTIFGLTDLSECSNLDKTIVQGKCIIDFETLRRSPHISKSFLFRIGLPDLYVDYLPDFYDEIALNLYPVFLSHNSRDKTFARKLYDRLIDKGVLVWFDEKKMRAGDDIYEMISTNIKSYDKMILVCSKNALKNSWWVNKEIKEARKKEEEYFKKIGKETNIIVPITIDKYVYNDWDNPNKNYITNMYIEDFSNWEDEKEFELKLNKLVEALNANRKGDNLYSLLEK